MVASISGYGSHGPLHAGKAYDMLIQADSGLVSVTGTSETAPRPASPPRTSRPECTRARPCSRASFAARARDVAASSMSLCSTQRSSGSDTHVCADVRRQVPRMRTSDAAIAPYDTHPTCFCDHRRDGEHEQGQLRRGTDRRTNDRGWHALTHGVPRPSVASPCSRPQTESVDMNGQLVCQGCEAALWRLIKSFAMVFFRISADPPAIS
jgi:itaconate CoA-transferase